MDCNSRGGAEVLIGYQELYDLHAVAVTCRHDTVGHVPCAISTPCNLFLRKHMCSKPSMWSTKSYVYVLFMDQYCDQGYSKVISMVMYLKLNCKLLSYKLQTDPHKVTIKHSISLLIIWSWDTRVYKFKQKNVWKSPNRVLQHSLYRWWYQCLYWYQNSCIYHG